MLWFDGFILCVKFFLDLRFRYVWDCHVCCLVLFCVVSGFSEFLSVGLRFMLFLL